MGLHAQSTKKIKAPDEKKLFLKLAIFYLWFHF